MYPRPSSKYGSACYISRPNSQFSPQKYFCFVIMYIYEKIFWIVYWSVRGSAERSLDIYSPIYIFICVQHTEKGLKFAARIVVNIFYNNKQKLEIEMFLTIKLCTHAKLNCLIWNCFGMLNWIVWIRTVWLKWIAWNRNVFDN